MRYLVLVLSFLTSSYVMAAPTRATTRVLTPLAATLVKSTPVTTSKDGSTAASVPQGGPCVDQGYSDPTREPNYDCRGPGEDMLVPDTDSQPSIGVKAGVQAPAQKWDAVLMDRAKVTELGLRLKAIRRLRWLDLHKGADLLVIEQKYLRDTTAEKDKLSASQVASYREQLQTSRAELAKERSWYRSWTFGLILGVVVTAAAGAGIAIAVRK